MYENRKKSQFLFIIFDSFLKKISKKISSKSNFQLKFVFESARIQIHSFLYDFIQYFVSSFIIWSSKHNYLG